MMWSAPPTAASWTGAPVHPARAIAETAAALAQLDVLRAPVGSIIEALDALASMTADFRVNYANLINTALSNEV